ncbi:Fanconi anemia group J protein homolog isoform X1 [Pyrus x bretschneideri]|uniref:Fanconi anemia group J protein homolog isoform X1 n=1 Tax=Pyrus x bretschneideri TaxID=225117 RepID=UPI00202E05DD|nr:Fanconi anemia group J protein homolog isoform X1 [Pyrus x bretschneideri]
MVSATPGRNPNPTTKTSKNGYQIGGVQVEFPYHPYGAQLAFMSRVISTLDRAHRDGHCHALLESPTGTGKSLSLLCSTLAWQQAYKSKNQFANLLHSKPDPKAMTDPAAHGGGFVPEEEPSSVQLSEKAKTKQSLANNKDEKKKATPTIYYASRTHSQISQVIREYRKTSYRVPMAVLASRKHYCTNAQVHGRENIDEECKLLLKNREVGCLEFKNVNKIKGHPSLQKGGCHEAHDIEDLVKVGKSVKGCSYYAARSLSDDAELVFCPYNYIINPVIRGAMEVDIKGSIVVLDEAHNIEDVARDAGSVDIDEDILHKVQIELEQLCPVDVLVYQPLYETIQGLISWIEQRKNKLEKREFQYYVSCWTGDKALRELQEANVSQQCFPILLECAVKAFKAATDTESDIPHLSGMAVVILEGLFSSLTYFFSRNGCHMVDFQLALQRYVKRDAGASGDWTHTLSLWCLNPAVVFKDIADLSLSVILTSGTLSPMNSFSSELGLRFGTTLEAPHVIDVESQVWPAVISTGPGNLPLNASYKTADEYAFQDALGKSLEEIFKIVPGGCLVFFPSYKLMGKLCKRWHGTGQWSQLNEKKNLFVEPRGGDQEEFDAVLKGYYDSIRKGNKPVFGAKKSANKIAKKSQFAAFKCPRKSNSDGAAFLAVCRGKVSEGIDFSDDNARAVIIVGIPFPNINDIQVVLKQKYNDTHKSSKSLLSGNEWYCQQAFRALNQAAGRCIRHRFDYGAVILLDERYHKERNTAYVSKWLKKSIRHYNNFDTSMEELKSFFSDVKERVSKNMVSVSQSFEAKEEIIHPMGQNEGITKVKYQKLKKFDCCKLPENSEMKHDGQLTSQGCMEVQQFVRMDVDADHSKEIIDLDCCPQKNSGYPKPSLSMAFSDADPDISIVKETPNMDGIGSVYSPGSLNKDENSGSTSTTIEASSNEMSFQSVPLTNSCRASPKAQCSLVATPKKNVTLNMHSSILETESSLNLSVNSHTQKRRKSLYSPLVNFVNGQSDAPDSETPDSTSSVKYSMASRDANRKIEFSVETNGSEPKSKSNVPHVLTTNNCVASSTSVGCVMDKRLQISCSLCKTPLGLPENQLHLACSVSSSSKCHLESLRMNVLKFHTGNTSSSGIPVIITDSASVDQRLLNSEGATGQGIWCEEDGCVFSTIFCPFCSSHNNCLGVQVMAANMSNVHLLNKILFYLEQLHIQNLEASSDRAPEDKDLLPAVDSSRDKASILNSFDRFSYSPQEQNMGGWRTTKSKLKLPKRRLLREAEG